MKGIFLHVVVILIAGQYVNASCPHEGISRRWSDTSSWAGNQIPGENDQVAIDSSILLDVDAKVDSIVVQQNAKLVFEPGKTLELSANYIHLNGGELHIGSDEDGCQVYQGEATITLTGDSGIYAKIPGFGEKFIGVDENAVLSVHGKPKRGWTKLDATIEPIEQSDIIYFEKYDNESLQSGLIINAFNIGTGALVDAQTFRRLRGSRQNGVDKDIEEVEKFLNDLPANTLTAFSIRKSLHHETVTTDHSKLFEIIEEYCFGTGSNLKTAMRELQFYDGFASICVKGDPSKSIEDFTAYKIGGIHQTSRVSLILDGANLKFEVTSYTSSRGFGKSFAAFEVTKADKSVPILTLAHEVPNWEIGDDIIITSSSSDWEEIEHGIVVECSSCGSKQTKLDWTPRNRHVGEMYKNTDTRAEVVNLSRNVKIIGAILNGQDKHGGHIKAVKGYTKMHIRNAELAHMGQTATLGNYPIHWHICEDTGDGLAEGNAIHNSYARCTTVHMTHNITVKDNVCVDSDGHGFFEEDGGEIGTVFEGNFAAGQVYDRNSYLIPTDKYPAAFYITNPNTTLKGNCAGGGQGDGYWFLFAERPTGPGNSVSNLASMESLRTPITQFENNIAHSNERCGLMLYEALTEETDSNGDKILKTVSSLDLAYDPRVDPTDENSSPSPAKFDRFTGYNNEECNIKLRGGQIEVNFASVANSDVGIDITRVGDGQPSVKKSVVIGEIPDSGQSSRRKRSSDEKRMGYIVNDGAVVVEDVYFGDFSGTESGALTFDNADRDASPLNAVKNLVFGFDDPAEGRRVYYDESDPSQLEMLVDADGSVTTLTPEGGSIVRDDPFLSTSNCAPRASWGMQICEEWFSRVYTTYDQSLAADKVTIYRADNAFHSIVTTMEDKAPFNAILTDEANPAPYLIQLHDIKADAKSITINARGIEKARAPLMAVCLPKKDSSIKVKPINVDISTIQQSESSLQDVLDDTNGGRYFHDVNTGVVFFKLMSNEDPTDCPDGVCPKYKIVISGGVDEANWVENCKTRFQAAYPGTKRSIISLLRSLIDHKRVLNIPATIPATTDAETKRLEFGAKDTFQSL